MCVLSREYQLGKVILVNYLHNANCHVVNMKRTFGAHAAIHLVEQASLDSPKSHRTLRTRTSQGFSAASLLNKLHGVQLRAAHPEDQLNGLSGQCRHVEAGNDFLSRGLAVF